jgi:purine-binding chemotaxis protein CheW
MADANANLGRRQLVVFELCTEQYGLPIEQVQEIIRYSNPRHVSTSSAWIEGVINLRGKIVPVWSLASRLGVSAGEPMTSNIVIVESPEGTVGLIVDHVTEVLTIDSGQVEATPSASDPAVSEIAKLDGRLVILLDPSALVSDPYAAAA